MDLGSEPDTVQEIENNLSIANMDWEDFADGVDEDGVRRDHLLYGRAEDLPDRIARPHSRGAESRCPVSDPGPPTPRPATP
ncbi:hypothetical protein OG943_38580 [Amycolatopsis sp. NBC_00345]